MACVTERIFPDASFHCFVSRNKFVFGVRPSRTDEHERGPDSDLTLQFEAINQFSQEEKHVVRELLEGLILKYEARRWNNRTPEQSPIR
jgi:hypothetical protein